jgi:bifunctional non-homologous end joining protein LigD
LVRTRGDGKPKWLLIKHRDRYASEMDIAEEKPRSVLSKKLMAGIAKSSGGDAAKAAKADPVKEK